jgi:hypothetical protein
MAPSAALAARPVALACPASLMRALAPDEQLLPLY